MDPLSVKMQIQSMTLEWNVIKDNDNSMNNIQMFSFLFLGIPSLTQFPFVITSRDTSRKRTASIAKRFISRAQEEYQGIRGKTR
jgi:hypothetical protein